MVNKNTVILGLGAVLLMASTAAGTTLYINSKNQEQPPAQVVVHNHTGETRHVASAPRCNDGNITGKVLGGVGGGVVGSLMGGGIGKTATTIGGTLAGAYVGGQAIPTQNATCPH